MPGRTPYGNRMLLRNRFEIKPLNSSAWTNTESQSKLSPNSNKDITTQNSAKKNNNNQVLTKPIEDVQLPVTNGEIKNNQTVERLDNEYEKEKIKVDGSIDDLLSIMQDYKTINDEKELQPADVFSADDAVVAVTSSIKSKSAELISMSMDENKNPSNDNDRTQSDRKEIEKLLLSFAADEPVSASSTDADTVFFPLESAAAGISACLTTKEAELFEKFAKQKVFDEDRVVSDAKLLVTEGRLEEFHAKLRARKARIDERHANLCRKRGLIKQGEDRLQILETKINLLEETHREREQNVRIRERKAKQMESHIQLQEENLNKREEKLKKEVEDIERRKKILEEKESMTSIMKEIMLKKDQIKTAADGNNKKTLKNISDEQNPNKISKYQEEIPKKEDNFNKQQFQNMNNFLPFLSSSNNIPETTSAHSKQRKRSNSYETKVAYSTGQSKIKAGNSSNLSYFPKTTTKGVMGLWL